MIFTDFEDQILAQINCHVGHGQHGATFNLKLIELKYCRSFPSLQRSQRPTRPADWIGIKPLAHGVRVLAHGGQPGVQPCRTAFQKSKYYNVVQHLT